MFGGVLVARLQRAGIAFKDEPGDPLDVLTEAAASARGAMANDTTVSKSPNAPAAKL